MGVRKVDPRLCNGCGICIRHCPMDVFRLNEETNKAYIKYLGDCQGCFLCKAECSEDAIYCYPLREMRVALPW